MFWKWEAGCTDADFRERAAAGGGDGPAILRDCLQEFESAGEGNHACDVFDFAALDFAIFGGVIGVGKEFAYGGDAGAAVGLAYDFLGDEAVLGGPLGPNARDGGGGIDQDAVEIEEHTAALNSHHSMIPRFRRRFCVVTPRNTGDDAGRRKALVKRRTSC